MTRLRFMCTCCCVRSITYNVVTSGTHTPHPVQGNDKYKIFWGFNIQTDKVVEHR